MDILGFLTKHHAHAQVTVGIKIAALILVTLIVYHQDIIFVVNEALRNEPTSYIVAIPFLLSYLIYRKKKMLEAVACLKETPTVTKTIFKSEAVGGVLCILAFLLYWCGSYTFYPIQYHFVSLPFLVAGSTLIIFNKETLKVLAFPIIFLFFLTTPPLEAFYTAGTTLSSITSQVAYTILQTIGLPVTQTTEYGAPVIFLQKPDNSAFSLTIDRACSGTYSLTAFTIFSLFVMYIVRGKTWKKPAVFLVGFPLIYALNIIRIIFIVSIGYQYGSEVAMQALETFGNWFLIFMGTLVLLLIFEKLFKAQIFFQKTTTKCSQSHSSGEKENFCLNCGKSFKNESLKISKRDLYKISGLLLASILILPIQVPIFTLKESIQINIHSPGGERIASQVFPEVPGYKLMFAYRDKNFERIAGQDASLFYVYIPEDSQNATIWVAIEVGNFPIHGWEICLYFLRVSQGWQTQVSVLDLGDVQLVQNPPLMGRFFCFQYIGSSLTQSILYWHENALFQTGSKFEQKYVKISLITTTTPEDYARTKDLLLPFGEALANNWERTKTQSWIAPIVPKYGNMFIITTAVIFASILSLEAIQNRKRKRSNFQAFSHLIQNEEKHILRAVHQTGQKGKPTLNRIAATYEKLARKSIELGFLLEKLNEAETAGLVKREIASQEDEPILVWKSQLLFTGKNV